MESPVVRVAGPGAGRAPSCATAVWTASRTAIAAIPEIRFIFSYSFPRLRYECNCITCRLLRQHGEGVERIAGAYYQVLLAVEFPRRRGNCCDGRQTWVPD